MRGIGITPLVKLTKLTNSNSADIYVKCEGANPTGSMKDRIALSMIEGAEKRGQLRPGGTVVEYTGGSTGSSLAMVCASKGYKAHLVSSDAFAEEKLQTMRAFGAKVEIIPSGDGKITAELIDRMVERARELSQNENTFWTDQFNNVDNRNAYHLMGDEILFELDSGIDEFVAGVGTGGSFSGNAEFFKERLEDVRCVAVEAFHVRSLSGGERTGSHKLEGISAGFVPSICRLDLADEIIPVKDEDAYWIARLLALEEGIFAGPSTGANVWAAMQRAKEIGPGKKVVTIAADSGLKYLNSDLYR